MRFAHRSLAICRQWLPALTVAGTLSSATACDSWLTKPSLYNSVEVVTVRRTTGEPVAGVPLTLYTGQRPMGYGISGPDGHYTFTRVPQGNYGVRAAAPAGYAFTTQLVGSPPSTTADGLVVAMDTLSPVRFTFLKRGPGTITTFVRDANGAPLAGVGTVLYTSTAVVSRSATDANGVTRFENVPFGQYGVSIVRPFLYQSYAHFLDSLYSFHDAVDVDEGIVDSVRFVLATCGARVRIHVVDQNATPVPNVMTQLFTSTALVTTSPTDQSGTSLLAPAPCATILGVRAVPPPGYLITPGRGTEYFDDINLTPGKTADFTFVLNHVS